MYALAAEVPILRGEAPHSGYSGVAGRMLLTVEQLIFGKPSFPQVQSLEAGQRLFGSTWRVVAAPGHTPGSLALFNTETGDLLSGDTLISDFGCPRANTSLFTADSPKLVESALNLMSLEPKIIHPAHGKPTLVIVCESAGAVGKKVERIVSHLQQQNRTIHPQFS